MVSCGFRNLFPHPTKRASARGERVHGVRSGRFQTEAYSRPKSIGKEDRTEVRCPEKQNELRGLKQRNRNIVDHQWCGTSGDSLDDQSSVKLIKGQTTANVY